MCTLLASTHRYTKDSYSNGDHYGGFNVLFWGGMIPLVNELVCVSVEPSLWWHGSLVEMVALVAALAGLDEHYGPVEAFSIRAGEGHISSACATG